MRVLTLENRKFIPEEVAVLIYKTLIMSKMNYGGFFAYLQIIIYSNNQLQKIHNRALRICFQSDRYTSNIDLHNHAKVLPLSEKKS